MPIAERLQTWLEQNHAEYATLTHNFTLTSARTAEEAHIPGGKIAKAVVLKKSDDSFLLMVLPADHKIRLGQLHQYLNDEVGLATEQELSGLFPDCSEGAIPALGQAYGLRTMVENSLLEQPVVYIESGDHQTLVQLGHHQFMRLFEKAEWVEAAKHL